MKPPKRIIPLIAEGLVDEVLRQLKSGKEASVYVVRCGEVLRCAKIYKEANQRGFHQAVHYTEGRRVKNSRQARAMEKGSRYGRQEQEAAWQQAEANALYQLAAVGVRVPQPFGFFDGVLLMEFVSDEGGQPAPRLADLLLSAPQARAFHAELIRQTVRMLCAGIVHGDLSEFNILVDAKGPVIIDLPQAVDAAANNNAQRMFERDINNLGLYFGQFSPELNETRYAAEIWAHFQRGDLQPDTALTGDFAAPEKQADLPAIMREINAARSDHEAKLRYQQLKREQGR